MSKTVAEIAEGLTKAGKRALVRIGTDWTPEGSPGPARADAYSLWWGRCPKGLVENKVTSLCGMSANWSWKLTDLGRQVAAHLKGTDHGN